MLNIPEAVPIALEGLFRELEQRVMSDIVRRIKINGELTRSADWQIHRLHELGAGRRVIKKHIKEALDLSSKEINHLYKDVVRQGYAYDEQLYKVKGKPIIPFEDNKALQQLIESVISQTNGELFNITQSLGFAQDVNERLSFKPIAEYYQRTLDAAMLDITTGVFDYNTVLKRTVSEMTKSGLRTVDYASGWSNRVTVASRRAVMTGITQVTAKINEDNAQQLGTNYFEVSWHIGARPEHQVWQGKVYTREQLHTICGLGTGAGLCGWNCYHDYSPFVMGLSERTCTDEWLAEQNKRENTPTEYKGKEYTAYQASQRQRKLETQMRAQRQKIKLLKDGGADEEDIIAARAKYRVTSAEYADFSKAMDLPQQRERVTIDGLGDVGRGRWKVDNNSRNDIIKAGRDKMNVGINSIENPIEQRNTAKGNPNAIMLFDRPLNNRQQLLFDILPQFNSKAVVSKKTVSMKDLSALTAYTGDEFAMFTKGKERLIIRGNANMIDIDEAKAYALAKDGYKWSGHTHPGINDLCLTPSDGDYRILDCFKNATSVIMNSKGEFRTFEKRG